jgi:hypothetical protein
MLSPASTLRRYTATLLVALWVMPWVMALVHSQEHAHRYCLEHQAFEDTAWGTGQSSARAIGDLPQVTAVPAPVGAPHLAHESCPLPSAGMRDEAPNPEPLALITACLAASRPATAPPRALSSLPILATAPKSSPPARA